MFAILHCIFSLQNPFEQKLKGSHFHFPCRKSKWAFIKRWHLRLKICIKLHSSEIRAQPTLSNNFISLQKREKSVSLLCFILFFFILVFSSTLPRCQQFLFIHFVPVSKNVLLHIFHLRVQIWSRLYTRLAPMIKNA